MDHNPSSALPPAIHQPITDHTTLVAFFDQVAPWQKIQWGTQRVVELLARVDHPERGCRYVIVGGTNAKGSTSLYLAALLQACGLSVGVTVSPHISDIRERIQIQGRFITQDELIAVMETIRQALLDWPLDRLELPTYHEVWTVAALLAFHRAGCEWAVLEVGMGGRYDAVRAVAAEAAVLCPVSFDHMQYLGDTLAAIAGEKVEIFPPGKLVVTAKQHP
ncbi:MAG: Mur ligase family protein, partial [bacterium]